MKVAGKLIKKHRLNNRMTQRQLGAGICAQATVSLIEKRNRCPNLEILHPICQRLNLAVDSILKAHQNFNEIEWAILSENYQRAQTLCSQVSKRVVREAHLHVPYNCHKGTLALKNGNYFSAFYYFNRILCMKLTDQFNVYQAWANLGLGEVYINRDDLDKAREFVRDALGYFNHSTAGHDSHRKFKLVINLRLQLGKILGRLGRYQSSNRVNFETISLMVKTHSMYRLADVYVQLSRNFSRLNNESYAKQALSHAQFFDKLYRDPGSLQKLE